jgi:hypothetical protein
LRCARALACAVVALMSTRCTVADEVVGRGTPPVDAGEDTWKAPPVPPPPDPNAGCKDVALRIFFATKDGELFSIGPPFDSPVSHGFPCADPDAGSPLYITAMAVDRGGALWLLDGQQRAFIVDPLSQACMPLPLNVPAGVPTSLVFAKPDPLLAADDLYLLAGLDLVYVDRPSLALKPVGTLAPKLPFRAMTATADARLYGIFSTGAGTVGIASLDRAALAVKSTLAVGIPEPTLADIAGVAFWGGEFFIFTDVLVRYQPAADLVTPPVKLFPQPRLVVVAASSTCAPVVFPK